MALAICGVLDWGPLTLGGAGKMVMTSVAKLLEIYCLKVQATEVQQLGLAHRATFIELISCWVLLP